MLYMGFSNPLKSELLNQPTDVVKTSPHVRRQGIKLLVHNIIQCFNCPGHGGL